MRRSAFSLVELSIVLVILGLLVGGILAGQSLIRASELRSISAEYQRYTTAAYAFRDKYFGTPGDFARATRFWNLQTATDCISNSSTAAGSPGVCDGNGDDVIAGASNASAAGERFQFWRHLQSAGLVEGSLSGTSGSGGTGHMVIGQNVPASKLSGAGWTSGNYTNADASGATDFAVNYQNFLIVGGPVTNNSLRGSILKPEEAWNVDTKLDDGKPARGKVMALQYATCTDAASNTALDSSYALGTSTLSCFLIFPRAF